MTNIEYEKLTIDEKVALANDKSTPKDLIKKIIEEDNMELKIKLMMSSEKIMEHISKK